MTIRETIELKPNQHEDLQNLPANELDTKKVDDLSAETKFTLICIGSERDICWKGDRVYLELLFDGEYYQWFEQDSGFPAYDEKHKTVRGAIRNLKSRDIDFKLEVNETSGEK